MAEQMSTVGTSATTEVLNVDAHAPDTDDRREPTVRLVLRKPKKKKKVAWTEETVDNEHMNKRKSKCCCIYKKPHDFGESSTDTEDECDNCTGHPERKPPPPPPPSVPPVS